jgi:hypothetical protein
MRWEVRVARRQAGCQCSGVHTSIALLLSALSLGACGRIGFESRAVDTWFATGAGTSTPFGAAQNLTIVNAPDADNGPSLSADGRELFWTSNRSGSYEIWRSYRNCL